MERILIIDDELPMREVLKEILELEGYAVETASDGNEGLARFCEGGIDLVITDIIMPHKDGISLIDEIKTSHPHARVIAMSGTQKMNLIADAVDVEANRIVAKPFDRDEMLDAVAQLLEYKPVIS
jgi:two-component system, NtrC family, response regulator HydG